MKNWGRIIGWSLFAVLVITLLVVARRMQEQTVVAKPNISIRIDDENAFLTEDELLVRLKRKGLVFEGQRMEELNTAAIEAFIHEMHEVESVEVFKRMAGNWDIRLKVRRPLARIFNTQGESFYVDSKGATMDPSPNFTARVLIFSGNISDRSDTLTVGEIVKNDSLVQARQLDDVYRLAKYISENKFLKAQIAQVHRTLEGDFVLIPQVGNHKIIFGSAYTNAEVKEKLDKLVVFYEEGLPYEGWSKYETINVKFKNQIVCKKRKVEEPEIIPQPVP
jgi:cell division protein FtsQ